MKEFEELKFRISRLEHHLNLPKTNPVTDHPKTWSEFERTTLDDALNDFLLGWALKFGRTARSIAWEVSRRLDNKWK